MSLGSPVYVIEKVKKACSHYIISHHCILSRCKLRERSNCFMEGHVLYNTLSLSTMRIGIIATLY